MTTYSMFEKAKKEAFAKVQWKDFRPEFDNLVDETVESLLFKALYEYDLILEQPKEFIDERYGGFTDSGVTKNGLERYKKKIVGFITKYREFCEDELEKKVFYKEFK
ncbi:hypothetical protein [Bacillus infantis]|uniref:hypothetical protein n=1 Tax=Bacillus infantis TaxID=324767 RepID=UPI003CF96F5A